MLECCWCLFLFPGMASNYEGQTIWASNWEGEFFEHQTPQKEGIWACMHALVLFCFGREMNKGVLLKEIPWMLLHGKNTNWCLHLLFANWYQHRSGGSWPPCIAFNGREFRGSWQLVCAWSRIMLANCHCPQKLWGTLPVKKPPLLTPKMSILPTFVTIPSSSSQSSLLLHSDMLCFINSSMLRLCFSSQKHNDNIGIDRVAILFVPKKAVFTFSCCSRALL
jgi:hypothetical protein